ncbi:MAG: hypothetical protein ACYC2Y_00275 [Armatimonadota bacterium]
MTKKIWQVLVPAALVLAALFTTSALAQRGPGGPGGPGGMGPGGMRPMGPPPPRVLLAGTEGIYLLQGGTLLKLDPKSLDKKGSVDISGGEGTRPGPVEVLLANKGASEQVLVVAGNRFLRIDGRSLTVQARGTLSEVQRPEGAPGEAGALPGGPGAMGPGGMGPGGPGMGPGGPGMEPMGPPPVLELSGRTLYVLRGPEIAAVNIDTGDVGAEATLPRPDAK